MLVTLETWRVKDILLSAMKIPSETKMCNLHPSISVIHRVRVSSLPRGVDNRSRCVCMSHTRIKQFKLIL